MNAIDRHLPPARILLRRRYSVNKGAARSCLFDYLVGAAKDGQRDLNSERLGGLEIENHLDLRRLL
jgi:hypothetical protein